MANVKLVNGLALASMKTFDSLAAASVKTIGGVDATSGALTPDIVWYKMNEGSGTALNNDVVTQSDATTNASWSSGELDFNGTTGHAISDANIEYAAATAVTVSMWLTLDDSSTVQVVTESSPIIDTYPRSFILYINAGEFVSGAFFPTGDRTRTFTTPSTGVKTNVVAVYDFATNNDGTHFGVVKIFYNGAEQTPTGTNNTNTATAATTMENYQINIAFRSDAGGQYFFNGKCDDYRIYNGELTSGQILDIYTSGPQ